MARRADREELQLRTVLDGWTLHEGPILETPTPQRATSRRTTSARDGLSHLTGA
jgi:hypothetical protein